MALKLFSMKMTCNDFDRNPRNFDLLMAQMRYVDAFAQEDEKAKEFFEANPDWLKLHAPDDHEQVLREVAEQKSTAYGRTKAMLETMQENTFSQATALKSAWVRANSTQPEPPLAYFLQQALNTEYRINCGGSGIDYKMPGERRPRFCI